MSVSKLASSSSSLKEVSRSDLDLRINSDPNLEMTSKMNLKGNERKTSMTLRSEKKDSDGPSQHDCVDAESVKRGEPIEMQTLGLSERHPVEDEHPNESSDIEVEERSPVSFHIGTRSGVHDTSAPDGTMNQWRIQRV